jgi:hypothetical protein
MTIRCEFKAIFACLAFTFPVLPDCSASRLERMGTVLVRLAREVGVVALSWSPWGDAEHRRLSPRTSPRQHRVPDLFDPLDQHTRQVWQQLPQAVINTLLITVIDRRRTPRPGPCRSPNTGQNQIRNTLAKSAGRPVEPTAVLGRGDLNASVVCAALDVRRRTQREYRSWCVPRKTQGLVVTEDLFIYSTSHGRNNRSNIYVVRRGEGSSDLDTARMFCFRSPSMSEGLTVYGNDIYVAYESGAAYYSQASDKPDNIIEDLHKAPLSKLESLPPR